MSAPFFFSLLLLAGSSLQAQSLLWKITGNGLQQPAWIYGTMHVRDSRVFHLPAGWEDKLTTSGRLLLELNPTEQADPVRMMEWMSAPEDSTLEQLLTEEKSQKLKRYVEDSLHLPWQMVNRLKPFFLFAMVQESQMAQDMPVALDLWLARVASEKKVPVSGLETLEEQLTTLNKLSLHSQAGMLAELIEQTPNSGEKESENQLMNAYLSGNLEQMAVMARNWDADPLFRHEVLEVRNLRMKERIQETLSSQGSAFIAVGALHLPGESGLIRGLQNAGFTVTPEKP